MPSLVMQEEEEEEEREKVPFLLSSTSLDELPLADREPDNGARLSNLQVSSQQMDSEQEISTFHGIERVKTNLPPSSTSTRGAKLFSRGILSKSRYKSSRDPNDGAVESGLLTPSTSSKSVMAQQRDIKASGSGSFLWARVLMRLSSGRMTLLSSNPLPNCSFEESMNLRGVPSIDLESGTTIMKKGISRSLSVPVQKSGSLKRLGSSGGYVLVRSASRPFMAYESVDSKETNGEGNVEVGEEIPEEEAVCRICMDVLNEGGETLKMECSCKGELALAHTDCAMKWFGIKGNRTCDVCGMEVQNLPVTLIRLPSQEIDDQYQTERDLDGSEVVNRIWHGTPFLVMVSMLAYFCFLELLLVRDLGSSALAIALPFACVLGIFSSIIASTVVRKRIVWPYATLQFSLVIIFSHLFYEVVHTEPIVAIWLATLSGIVVAMGISALVFEFEKWRNRVE